MVVRMLMRMRLISAMGVIVMMVFRGGAGRAPEEIAAALDEQVEAEGDDQNAGDELQPGNDQRGQDVMRCNQRDQTQSEYRAGMRERDNAAE